MLKHNLSQAEATQGQSAQEDYRALEVHVKLTTSLISLAGPLAGNKYNHKPGNNGVQYGW